MQRILKKPATMTIMAMALILLASCASSNRVSVAEGLEINDPIEDTNRVILNVNEAIDKAVLEPVARGYRYATPEAFRYVLRNFLRNLKSPIIIANQLLQGDLEGTANSTGRFVINTLAGFGGILDLAEQGGIPYEPEDFGQTLAVWGVDNGPYLVIPLLGPSTARDATGSLVDMYADPVRIYLFNTDREGWHYGRTAASIIDQREEMLELIDDLRRNSYDYYAAIRSAYVQRRQALVNDLDPDVTSAPAIPDYTD